LKPHTHMLANLLFHLYQYNRLITRSAIRNVVGKLEGGEVYSPTLRRILRVYHDVDIGLYTHGGCFVPGTIDRHTTIGRYCSFAHGVRSMNANHPMEFKSTHAFFHNPVLGYCSERLAPYVPLSIGNDVWIGACALVLPHVRQIGDGAVIAAGAVVNKDIPPYAVVVGNPARVVRLRFPQAVIDQLLASRWWEKPIEDLDLTEFTKPFLTGAVPLDAEGLVQA